MTPIGGVELIAPLAALVPAFSGEMAKISTLTAVSRKSSVFFNCEALSFTYGSAVFAATNWCE